MLSYDWRDYQERAWTERFPDWSQGFETWRAQESVEHVMVSLFEARRALAFRPHHLRVFISHRQTDIDPALRIAYLACQEGFDYWLDVLDPTLASLPGVSPGSIPKQTCAAIAAVIEMALLNSTHVVAVMTPNTVGSQWVPYEYGRVKQPTPITLQAASWIASALSASALPEYLYLGAITKTEQDLSTWFESELTKHGRNPVPCVWSKPVPAPL